MKEKLQTMVNTSQLFIMTGYQFDVNRVAEKNNKGHKYKKAMKVSLFEIIDSGLLTSTSSSDERFDKKCRITQSLESLENKGLPLWLFQKITKTKSCVKKAKMMGVYSFLNDLISPEEKRKLHDRLKSARDYLYQHGVMP